MYNVQKYYNLIFSPNHRIFLFNGALNYFSYVIRWQNQLYMREEFYNFTYYSIYIYINCMYTVSIDADSVCVYINIKYKNHNYI